MDIDIHQSRTVNMLSTEENDVVMANKQQQQKRRAVFGDITNNTGLLVSAGKKKCLENVSMVIPEVVDEETLDTEIAVDDIATVHTIGVHSAVNTSCVMPESEEMTVDWVDVDKENTNPSFVSTYVNDIFDHYRRRELNFVVSDYLHRQPEMSTSMRAILIDWLVEVQQSFELVHETLYLAVKLTDCYLDRQTKTVAKNLLQLIGSTALNIACKFEERSPPVIDDFLYVCDDAYTRGELLEMEKHILKAVDFDIGIPLSYTFLRRYAQCGRVSTPTLTLARFVLEMSLMDYSYVTCYESKMAAASLLLAMNMNCDGQWDATVTHYTQYTVADLTELTSRLNAMLTKPPNKSLKTIMLKYSHQVFHEVAKIAPLNEQEMQLLQSCNSSGRSVVRYNPA